MRLQKIRNGNQFQQNTRVNIHNWSESYTHQGSGSLHDNSFLVTLRSKFVEVFEPLKCNYKYQLNQVPDLKKKLNNYSVCSTAQLTKILLKVPLRSSDLQSCCPHVTQYVCLVQAATSVTFHSFLFFKKINKM